MNDETVNEVLVYLQGCLLDSQTRNKQQVARSPGSKSQRGSGAHSLLRRLGPGEWPPGAADLCPHAGHSPSCLWEAGGWHLVPSSPCKKGSNALSGGQLALPGHLSGHPPLHVRGRPLGPRLPSLRVSGLSLAQGWAAGNCACLSSTADGGSVSSKARTGGPTRA